MFLFLQNQENRVQSWLLEIRNGLSAGVFRSIMQNNYAWKAVKQTVCIIHDGLNMGFVLGLEGNLKANKGYASKSYCLDLEDNPVYSNITAFQRNKPSSGEVRIRLNLSAHYCTW